MERQISIRLPRRLLAELDKRARRSKRPRAELIREMLSAYLGVPERPLPSVYDSVRDLIGSVDGLPRDLSSNPKYMDDFGKPR